MWHEVFFWQFSSSHMTNNYRFLKQELHCWCITNKKSNCTEENTRLRSAQGSYKHHTQCTESSVQRRAVQSEVVQRSTVQSEAVPRRAVQSTSMQTQNVKECKQQCNCAIVQVRLDLEMETAKRSLVFRQSTDWVQVVFLHMKTVHWS